MKKRFVTTLFAFIACIACLFGFAACGDTDPVSVAGKTFVFEKMEITAGLEGKEKEEAEAQMNELYKDSYLEFGTDDGFAMMTFGHSMEGTYAQDESKLSLTIDEETLEGKVSGDTIILSNSKDGMSASMTYKLSANKS